MREILDDFDPKDCDRPAMVWDESPGSKWVVRGLLAAIGVVGLLLLWSLSTLAHAAESEWHFTTGEVMQHAVSVCLELPAAKTIVDADAAGGFEAGTKAWAAQDSCATIEVVGPKVGKVVYAKPVKRAERAQVLKVVEVLHPTAGNVLGYFLTTREVFGSGRPVGYRRG